MELQLRIDTISLNYLKKGKGNPLLLLHGNGEDHTIFNPLTDLLASHFTVYAIDSRNHGKSSKTDDYSYETMAEDIVNFIKELKLTEVFITGFSDGAIIALMLEMAHPNTFKKMALLGINLKPSDFKEENLHYLKEEYEKTRDPLVRMMLEEPNIDLDNLKNIKTNTLIIRAEDELFEDKLYANIVNTIPNSKLLIMEGHDHGSYIIGSTVLYDDLISFFV